MIWAFIQNFIFYTAFQKNRVLNKSKLVETCLKYFLYRLKIGLCLFGRISAKILYLLEKNVFNSVKYFYIN